MVAITKWIILGLGILTASFFFKEAAGSSLTGTLQRTGLAGQSLGTGIAATGAGVGEFGVRILDPFFSLADLFSKFGNLFGGNGSETITQVQTPPAQITGGVVYAGSTNRSGGGFSPSTGPGPTGPGDGPGAGVGNTGPTSGGGLTSNGTTGNSGDGNTGGGGRPNPQGGTGGGFRR